MMDVHEVPDYPVNIKVQLDSWRYQILLIGVGKASVMGGTIFNFLVRMRA